MILVLSNAIIVRPLATNPKLATWSAYILERTHSFGNDDRQSKGFAEGSDVSHCHNPRQLGITLEGEDGKSGKAVVTHVGFTRNLKWRRGEVQKVGGCNSR